MGFWILVIAVVLVLPVAVVIAVVSIGRRAEDAERDGVPASQFGAMRAIAVVVLGAWAFVSIITMVGALPLLIYAGGLGAYALAARRETTSATDRGQRLRRTGLVGAAAMLLAFAAGLLLVLSALGIVPGWSAVGVTVLGLWLAAPLVGLAIVGFRWSRRDLIGRRVGVLCIASLALVGVVAPLAVADMPMRLEVLWRRDAMDQQARSLLESFAAGHRSYSESVDDIGGFSVRGAYEVSCADGPGTPSRGVHYWVDNSSSYLAYCPLGGPVPSRGRDENIHLVGNWWVEYPALLD